MALMAPSEQKEADRVKRSWFKDKYYKQILEIGDVGVIHVEGNTRGATFHPTLSVMSLHW